ncbi:MAG: DUF1343 domain-containing protein [Lacibacter sp.]
MIQPIQYGIDVFLQQPNVFKNKRIALVTNNAATTISGELSRVALVKSGFNLVTLFSPEHGIATTGDDGVFQQNITDPVTGLPVISLYADKLAPSKEDLQNIDLVLFDIPDVGCRFYTYLWTMTHAMEACAANQKTFVVLDRPNPIGAELSKAEGPFLDEQNCSSFIGRWNIPLKHSCTLGELALYFAATKISALNIEVIKTQHYKRTETAVADFFFTPTSPAIQLIETAMLYPGTGLLEGINVNEGRGTEQPFQICGAPWMKNEELKQSMEQHHHPGFAFTTCVYKPVAGMFAAETCNGLQLHITDANKVSAVKTGIALVQTIIQLHPQTIKERLYTTNANPTGIAHLDKLLGVQHAFTKLQQGHSVETNVATEWEQTMKPYLLYD